MKVWNTFRALKVQSTFTGKERTCELPVKFAQRISGPWNFYKISWASQPTIYDLNELSYTFKKVKDQKEI